MTAATRPAQIPVTVADLSAGDVIEPAALARPVVVEAIHDVDDARRVLDVSFLTFGTSPGRLVLAAGEAATRLDVTVWAHVYTNVTDAPVGAWVRGHRITVPPGGRVEVVDAAPRREFVVATWHHEQQPVRPSRLGRTGWQVLRPVPEPAVSRSLVG